jgi:hypothetical protein
LAVLSSRLTDFCPNSPATQGPGIIRGFLLVKNAVPVKVFGRRPHDDGAPHSGPASEMLAEQRLHVGLVIDHKNQDAHI